MCQTLIECFPNMHNYLYVFSFIVALIKTGEIEMKNKTSLTYSVQCTFCFLLCIKICKQFIIYFPEYFLTISFTMSIYFIFHSINK